MSLYCFYRGRGSREFLQRDSDEFSELEVERDEERGMFFRVRFCVAERDEVVETSLMLEVRDRGR